MSDLVPVKRALISVFDKTGLAEFATALVKEFGVELISTGGTAKFLRDLGLKVADVSQVTGFPEMMDGRVKTLHPKIHGGLLALRDNAEHVAAMKAHGIEAIDLVCINLYPFEQTIAKPGVTFEEAIENIDIGGPSMVRSAAKNHRSVLVVTSPERYEKVLGDLREHGGATCGKHRLKMAQRAFAMTSRYDGLIAKYLEEQIEQPGKSATGSGTSRISFPPHEGSIATAAAIDPSNAGRIQDRLREGMASPSVGGFVHDLILAQALSVGGTEAIAFAINSGASGLTFKPVAHVRPDNAPEKVRAEAISAFEEIVTPCIEQNQNGAIAVGTEKDKTGRNQFCLVTLLKKDDRIAGVSAVIARFESQQNALEALTRMDVFASYFWLRAESGLDMGPFGIPVEEGLADQLKIRLKKKQDLRYGENPHQKAALYVDSSASNVTNSVAFAQQLHGKELSYINLLDADAALAAVVELATPTACIVKHATPCGFATATELAKAFTKAWEGDPLAAFGGIVAVNQKIDLATAQAITSGQLFLEVIVAPAYDADALELLKNRWKNVRLLVTGPLSTQHGSTALAGASATSTDLMMHKIVGGYLVQERDMTALNEADWKVVSKRKPSESEMRDLRLAWIACKHLKSNAVAVAKDEMMLGGGAGQQDRVNACRIAIAKAGERVRGGVAASDAFFPFPDGPKLLLEAGVTAIIHPGGSVRDNETLAVVDEAGAAMVLTGQRHFKH